MGETPRWTGRSAAGGAAGPGTGPRTGCPPTEGAGTPSAAAGGGTGAATVDGPGPGAGSFPAAGRPPSVLLPRGAAGADGSRAGSVRRCTGAGVDLVRGMADAAGRGAAGDTRMPRAGVADGGFAGRTGCRWTTGTGAGEAEGDEGGTSGRCGAPIGGGAVGDTAPGRAGAADGTGRAGEPAETPGTGAGAGADGDDTSPVRLDTATGATGEDPDAAAEAR